MQAFKYLRCGSAVYCIETSKPVTELQIVVFIMFVIVIVMELIL